MAGYYKTIKGKKYDGKLIDLAGKLTSGSGDGRLSLNDAKKILKAVKDSDSYSDLEKKTMQYIRDHYKFTKESNAWFRTEIRKWAASKKGGTPAKKPARPAQKPSAVKKPLSEAEITSLLERPAPSKSAAKPAARKSRPWLWILIILLVIGVILALIFCPCVKKLCTKKAPDTIGGVKPPAPEIVVPSEKPAEPAVAPAEKEDPCIYVVQPKDSLVSIAEQKLGDYRKWEKIYNDNRGQIAMPSMIYIGQRLRVGCD